MLIGVSAVLFALGLLGVIVRRNVLVMLMCMELMLNGAGLALVVLGVALLASPASPSRVRRRGIVDGGRRHTDFVIRDAGWLGEILCVSFKCNESAPSRY